MTLVFRDAFATGVGSANTSSLVPWPGGVTRGRTVERASGKRRVRNSVDACRYVLEIFDDCLLDVFVDVRDEIEDRKLKGSDAVVDGLSVAVGDPGKAMTAVMAVYFWFAQVPPEA